MYQNLVLSVNLGLSSYGYLKQYAKIQSWLKQKRVKTLKFHKEKSELKK